MTANSIKLNIRGNAEMDFTLLQSSFATEICPKVLKWEGTKVRVSQHATRFTSIWLLRQGNFCGMIKLSLGGSSSSVWRALNLFHWKPLNFTLTALEGQNYFCGIGHLFSESKSINFTKKLWKYCNQF